MHPSSSCSLGDLREKRDTKEMAQNPARKSCNRRIVIVPAPFQGHTPSLMQLATKLHSEGFSITVVHTLYNFSNLSDYFPDFHFLTIPDGLSRSVVFSLGIVGFIMKLNTVCEPLFRECLVGMLSQQADNDKEIIACVIYDEIMYFSGAVAEHLKLPSIIYNVSNATGVVSRAALIQLEADGLLPPRESELQEDLVPGLYPLRFKDLPTAANEQLDSLLQLFENISNVRTSAFIFNTVDCLEASSLSLLLEKWQRPVFPVGPLHRICPATCFPSLLEEEFSCISWLDKQKPNSVIYISLGSVATIQQEEAVEMAWGLADSQQPFLWAIRPGSLRGSEWMESLPEEFNRIVAERGCIVKWAPQREVLAHCAVGGFWSHCGWNSTLESMCEGVPMICRPSFGDQKANARYLSCIWEMGIQVEGELERGKVERAVRRLMVHEEGEEMRNKAMDLKQKVEASVRKGDSSHNSFDELVDHIMSLPLSRMP